MPLITDHHEHPHHKDVVVLRKWFQKGMLRSRAQQMSRCAARELKGRWKVERIGLWIETEYEMSQVCGGQIALLVDKATTWARANPDPGPSTFCPWRDFSLQAHASARANSLKWRGQQEARPEDIIELRMWFKRGMLSGFAKKIMDYLRDQGFLDRKFWINKRITNWIRAEKSLFTLHGGEESKVLERAKLWSKTLGHTNPDPLVESTWFFWEEELEIERRKVIFVKSEEPEEGFIFQIPIYISTPSEVKTEILEQVEVLTGPDYVQTTLIPFPTPPVTSSVQKVQSQGKICGPYYATTDLQRSHEQKDAAIGKIMEIQEEQVLLAKQWDLIREARLCNRTFEEEQLIEPSYHENKLVEQEGRYYQQGNKPLLRPEKVIPTKGKPCPNESSVEEYEQIQRQNCRAAKEMLRQQQGWEASQGRPMCLISDTIELNDNSVDGQNFEKQLRDEIPEEGAQYELLLDGLEHFLELAKDEVQEAEKLEQQKRMECNNQGLNSNTPAGDIVTIIKGVIPNHLLANTTEPTQAPASRFNDLKPSCTVQDGISPQEDLSNSRGLILKKLDFPFDRANSRNNTKLYNSKSRDRLGKSRQRNPLINHPKPAKLAASLEVLNRTDNELADSMETNVHPPGKALELDQSDKPIQNLTTPNHTNTSPPTTPTTTKFTTSSLPRLNSSQIFAADSSNQPSLPHRKKRKPSCKPRAEDIIPREKYKKYKKNKKSKENQYIPEVIEKKKKKKKRDKGKSKEKLNLHQILQDLHTVTGLDLFKNELRLDPESESANRDVHNELQAEFENEDGKVAGTASNITILNFNIKKMKVRNLFQSGIGMSEARTEEDIVS